MFDSLPESLTTCGTPAAFAASMNVHWVSNMSGVALEISNARSTPSRAGPSDSGFVRSPTMSSTPRRSWRRRACASSRTRARTRTPWRANTRSVACPLLPAAPVTKIIDRLFRRRASRLLAVTAGLMASNEHAIAGEEQLQRADRAVLSEIGEGSAKCRCSIANAGGIAAREQRLNELVHDRLVL